MKYDKQIFDEAVADYKKRFTTYKKKTFLILLEMEDSKGYHSLAPLSMALHELDIDIHVVLKNKSSKTVDVLFDVWDAFGEGMSTKRGEALRAFIDEVEKKTKGKFVKIMQKPDVVLEGDGRQFKGTVEVPYHHGWYKEYRWDDLIETADNLWEHCYDLKKGEKISCGFELVPPKKHLELPLEDYLDNFSIARAMMTVARRKGTVKMAASTSRFSMLEPAERIGELKSTLLGCELDKEVKEKVFEKFKVASKLLKLDRIEPPDLAFFVSGKGYKGKHLFGEVIGYPTLDGKMRWSSPGEIIYQFDWFPQTAHEKRKPMARVGFTETLPLDIFIESCNIDYDRLRERNQSIMSIMEKSEFIHVEGKKIDGVQSKFNVFLKMANGKRRWVRESGSDVRTKINAKYKKMTGIDAGRMANHPGGEGFVTPEYIEGTVVGDVVIAIDQSYVIPKDKPFVFECSKKGYKVVKADKRILAKFEKKKKEAWQNILDQEKHKSLPQAIINLKKRNFNNIGEFAINTNPTAKLCDYLIVNEKIANMIHVAMGSGFEPDKATEYHTDVVIDSPRQELDIYGVDEGGNKLWLIRKGQFVI